MLGGHGGSCLKSTIFQLPYMKIYKWIIISFALFVKVYAQNSNATERYSFVHI